MLIQESHVDVPVSANGKDGSMRIYVFHPTIPGYPKARFPGVCLFSEIYQVTGPVARFARQIAGQGYIVAAPSSYHDFVGPEPLAYDAADTDRGNQFKIQKTLESSTRASPPASPTSPPTSTRAPSAPTRPPTRPPRHSPGSAHTLDNFKQLRGEVALIFGIKDTHVPDAGRDLIRAKLRDAGVVFSFHEFAWAQHAFIRDELSKGRYDPAITKVCFEVLLELFGRVLKTDLGPRDGAVPPRSTFAEHPK
ncbi:hypothetical protein ACCO45_005107 [Purpureocillium lilacinum]|uniref:Uncharacterized protein n=1 Tax=Purpureocillium lilacinum TaxID=33203 RepID=A0ACC4DXC4_PURLI